MSAAGRSRKAGTGRERRAHDQYFTPAWCVRAVLPHLAGLSGSIVSNSQMRYERDVDLVLDPCCGEGGILDVVAEAWPGCARVGIELDPALVGEARGKKHRVFSRDAIGTVAKWPVGTARRPLVLTNPPYAHAHEFADRAIEEVDVFGGRGVVAMLLRLNWLASQKRADWMRAHTPSVYVLPKRPSFAHGATDATEYGFLVWNGQPPTVRILEVPSTDARASVR